MIIFTGILLYSLSKFRKLTSIPVQFCAKIGITRNMQRRTPKRRKCDIKPYKGNNHRRNKMRDKCTVAADFSDNPTCSLFFSGFRNDIREHCRYTNHFTQLSNQIIQPIALSMSVSPPRLVVISRETHIYEFSEVQKKKKAFSCLFINLQHFPQTMHNIVIFAMVLYYTNMCDSYKN